MAKARKAKAENGKPAKSVEPPKPAVMGAPRKIDDPVIRAAIVAFVSAGGSRTKAADHVGIHASTIENEARRNPDFLESLTHAEATNYMTHIKNVSNAGADDWRASAFILERKWPGEFGKVDTHYNKNVDDERISGVADDKQREAIINRLRGILQTSEN